MKIQFYSNKDFRFVDSIVRKKPERFVITEDGIKSLASIGITGEDTIKRSHLLSLVQKGYAYPIEAQFEAERAQTQMELNLDQGEFDYLPRCEETDSVYEISLVILQEGSSHTAHLYCQ